MAEFDTASPAATRPRSQALHERLGFDYYSIDCAETRDGRLLVFEADTAAIIHLMDPPDLFPYKQPQMRRVFAAFEAMLRSRTTSSVAQRPTTCGCEPGTWSSTTPSAAPLRPVPNNPSRSLRTRRSVA